MVHAARLARIGWARRVGMGLHAIGPPADCDRTATGAGLRGNPHIPRNMHFRDVVICDNAGCGAILRISDRPGPISVALNQGSFGSFIVCPRCRQSTLVDPAPAQAMSASPGEPFLPAP